MKIWECPDCGGQVNWSYEDLAKRGEPVCASCDVDMILKAPSKGKKK